MDTWIEYGWESPDYEWFDTPDGTIRRALEQYTEYFSRPVTFSQVGSKLDILFGSTIYLCRY